MTPAIEADSPASRNGFESTRAKSRRALFALIGPRGSCPPAALDGVDWDWTIERARAHKVGALLAARLRSSSVWAHLPATQTSALEALSGRAEAVVGAAERTISVLDRELREIGIPYLVMKGIVLSRLVYPEPNLRSFSDLDVVVSARNVAAAVALLQSHGYRQGQVRQTLGERPDERDVPAARRITRRFYERFDHEIPFVAPPGRGLLPVDLHWRIAPRRRLAIDTDTLWLESRPVRLAGVEVSTLNPEAMLIHLALHATTCSLAAFRLLHLCDVAWAVHGAAHDPDRLHELAERWGVRQQLGVVLEMTQRLFGSPLAADRFGAPSRRLTDDSFLLDEAPHSLPRRLWREAVWGATMGCLTHNVARSTAMRWTRIVWRGRRALDRVVPRNDEK